MSIESPEGNVGVDQLELSVDSNRSYSLEVSADDEPFETTPSFDLDEKTTSLGFVRVGHSVPDEEIGGVTFRFSVSKSKIETEELPQVALYRYHDGSWDELETRLVGETADSYVFHARSPGLSEFIVGKKGASFSVTNARIETNPLDTGDRLEVTLLISNTGQADGTFEATLYVDDKRVDQRAVSIAANGTRQATLSATVESTGTHQVLVNNRIVGEIDISGTADATETATTTQLTTVDSRDASLGVGVFGVLAIFVIAGSFRY